MMPVSIPLVADHNLLIAIWNVRQFGEVRESFETEGSPARNLSGLAHIAEIVRRLDVIAVHRVSHGPDPDGPVGPRGGDRIRRRGLPRC